jgi:hypothetical protein
VIKKPGAAMDPARGGCFFGIIECLEGSVSLGFDAALCQANYEVPAMDLDAIIECLANHRQRATYGAVAPLVGAIPLGVMKDKLRNFLNSWVVAQEDHEPTGYTEAEKDPKLKDNPFIIDDAERLRKRLSTRLP